MNSYKDDIFSSFFLIVMTNVRFSRQEMEKGKKWKLILLNYDVFMSTIDKFFHNVPTESGKIKIPKCKSRVMCDNLEASFDSHGN